MTLHPALPTKAPDVLGPMRCFRCGVTAQEDPTVYQAITISGQRWPALCSYCASKIERMTSLSRRGDCE